MHKQEHPANAMLLPYNPNYSLVFTIFGCVEKLTAHENRILQIPVHSPDSYLA